MSEESIGVKEDVYGKESHFYPQMIVHRNEQSLTGRSGYDDQYLYTRSKYNSSKYINTTAHYELEMLNKGMTPLYDTEKEKYKVLKDLGYNNWSDADSVGRRSIINEKQKREKEAKESLEIGSKIYVKNKNKDIYYLYEIVFNEDSGKKEIRHIVDEHTDHIYFEKDGFMLDHVELNDIYIFKPKGLFTEKFYNEVNQKIELLLQESGGLA